MGGSLLAWHDLWDSTEDVDSVRRLDDELRVAVASVARARGLAPGWLNADAEEVVEAFLAPYPHAPEDPELDSFVVDIVARAGHGLPFR